MNRRQSKEDYLERILMLQEEKDIVRAIDIATDMNYSKPSVSIALKKLRNEQLIEVCDKSGNVTLTEKGREIAIEVYQRQLAELSNPENRIIEENKLVNINTATIDELQTIKGVGESKAKSIIEYRKENKFIKIEDIKNVSGIGDSLFEKIKDYITI